MRIDVLKTYKLYIDGKFPRTESGRYYTPENKKGPMANICLSSRKDFRNAVVAARKAVPGWSGKSAYNRSQIIYRIAEMLEDRKDQFIKELKWMGIRPGIAKMEVEKSIDRLIYYAGWCDKYQQVFSSVNPVASSHFNFSVLEPTGVVAILAPLESGLMGLITQIVSAISGGNTCVILASEELPLPAITFGEVLQTSDVPAGVVNILTGKQAELLTHFATHMDVNAIVYCDDDPVKIKQIKELATDNVKRVIYRHSKDWLAPKHDNPYYILDTQEVKTTWHPIEKISETGSGY
jgi:acyl-CoA reductase-like NAD-dependent aldehyde dehydrogenase